MISSHVRQLSAASVRSLSTSIPKRVAVCLTDPRDGSQSNNSGSTAAHHMLHMSEEMNSILKEGVQKATSSGPMPFLQTTGGTVFMFDLWKRGVNPFDTLVEHFKATPDVPTSWLNRNVCLNGMEPYPREVVREYFSLIRDAKREAGNIQPYIMQTFCAQNDLNNLSVTFEEWKSLGEDFWLMPFFSFAKTPWDPCESNPERTASWFREVKAMTGGADMYGLKQPDGDMTAAYAKCHAQAVRSEIGNSSQLHLHTQGNHGLGLPTLLGAVKGGVDSVDSSFVFGGRGGQEDSFALRYLLESEGFEVNAWDEDRAIKLWEEQIEKWYPATHRYWRPDPIRANIAGGQRSILQTELDGLRQANRIKEIFDINMTIRCLGGGGVSVTPLADIYARNSLLWVRSPDLRPLKRPEAENLRQSPVNSATVEGFLTEWATGMGSLAEGDAMEDLLGNGGVGEGTGGGTVEDFPLTLDFAKMVLGHNGRHPCAPSSVLVVAAMHHLLQDRAAAAAAAGGGGGAGAARGDIAGRLGAILSDTSATGDRSTGGSRRRAVVELMCDLSRRALAESRIAQVDERIAELNTLLTPVAGRAQTQRDGARALVEREMQMSKQVDAQGQSVTTIAARIKLYEDERAKLLHSLVSSSSQESSRFHRHMLDVSSEEYARFLRTGNLNDHHTRIIASHCEGIADLAAEIETYDSTTATSGLGEILQLCREAGPKTVPIHELAVGDTASSVNSATSSASALTESREYMRRLNDDWLLGLTSVELRQWTLIHAKFRAHPLRLVQRYWRHVVGLEKVFAPLSTDPLEVLGSATDGAGAGATADGVFGACEYIPLSFDEPERLTSMYKVVVKRLREEIAKQENYGNATNGSVSAANQKIAQLRVYAGGQNSVAGISMSARGMSTTVTPAAFTSTLDADAYALAGECLINLETALMQRQFWEARTRQQLGKSIAHSNASAISVILSERIAAIDADIATYKAGMMPLLQTISVQNPGKYNQSRLRSIDDPSTYRNRIVGFADHTNWAQVEAEAEELWGIVCAQVANEALRKNSRANERYLPSSALDV